MLPKKLSRTDQDKLDSSIDNSMYLDVEESSATSSNKVNTSTDSIGNCSMSVNDYILRDDTVQFVYSMFIDQINRIQSQEMSSTKVLADEKLKLQSVQSVLDSKKNFTDSLDMLRNLRDMINQLNDRHHDARTQLLKIIDHYISQHRKDIGVDTDYLKIVIGELKVNISKLSTTVQNFQTLLTKTQSEFKEIGKVSEMSDKFRKSRCELEAAKQDLKNFKTKLETCAESGPVSAALMDDLPGPKNMSYVATYRNFRLFAVAINGPATSSSILRACEKHGLLTVCDHHSYYDGKCVVIQEGVHMSGNPLGLSTEVWRNKWWYTGNANSDLPLITLPSGNSHRWATSSDRDGSALCAWPTPAETNTLFANFKGWNFYPTRVRGAMTSSNILEACEKRNMLPVCDHSSYANGFCVDVFPGSGHFSNVGNGDFVRENRNWFYYYTGNNRYALQTIDGTHRWASAYDMYGLTMCVKSSPVNDKKPVESWEGYRFYRTRVDGIVSSRSILEACSKKDLTPVCDHSSYGDGKCIMIAGATHFSQGATDFPRNLIDLTFFYCGAANGNRALQNIRNSHRWSTDGDIDGVTWCVEPIPVNQSVLAASFQGFDFYPTLVRKVMTSKHIKEACDARDMLTPCDHSSYADGNCVNVLWNTHLSSNGGHDMARKYLDRTYWYCGNANGGWSLQNLQNSHRWSGQSDIDGVTLCMKRQDVDSSKVATTWNGYNFYNVLVKDVASSSNIEAACRALGLSPVCDHPSYSNGKCVVLFPGGHMSSGSSDFPKKLLDGKCWYTSDSARSLISINNSHRWSTIGDKFVVTMCVKKA